MGLIDKNTLLSAAGNFSTAYNFQIISVAMMIAGYVYPETKNVWTATESTAKTMAVVGAIFGQLTFGYVGDCLGRSKAMALTMALTVGGALLSCINVPFGEAAPGPFVIIKNNTHFNNDLSKALDHTHSQFIWIMIARFILGVGVGGVYPLAATVAAESASDNKSRGVKVSLVFSTQGLGFIMSPIIGLIVCNLNPSPSITLPGNPTNPAGWPDCIQLFSKGPVDKMYCAEGANDVNWRIVLALGALPGLLMMPFKVTETSKARTDPTKQSTFWADVARPEYRGKLFGTAGGWFLFDIVFYGNTLFKGAILAVLSKEQSLNDNLVHSTILFAIALPGYWVATVFMERLGRKNIQMIGFGSMFILYMVLSQLMDDEAGGKVEAKKGVSGGLLIFIYGLTFFFANFGPNSTTFILPSETFPEEVRTSMNGFSAAMGKTGGAIGSAMFLPLAKSIGAKYVIVICGIISLLGLLLTKFFVEDRRGKSLASSSSTMGYASINNEKTGLLSSPVTDK